jgi:hypothetical protein
MEFICSFVNELKQDKMLNEIIAYLDENFSVEKVTSMFDDEVLGLEENCDSEYDWYIKYHNGEAEYEVRRVIAQTIKIAFPNLDESIELHDVIREKYEFLDK